TPRQWEVLIATGTNHLMAISGLHIGLVAGLVYLLVRWLWVFAGSLALTVPAPKAGAFAALLAAMVYAALAGFSIPTQRALVMIAVAMGAVLLQRHVLPRQGLALALLLVLLLDPLAVLAPGFWLSFAAVAVILYGMAGRLSPRGIWWRWGRVQWLVAIGLLPFMLLLFGRVAPLSPLANIIAVPWMGFLVVPLTLLGALLLPLTEPVANLLLTSAVWLVELLWPLLEGLADASSGLQFPAPPLWAMLPGLIGMAWLLAPRGWPVRGLGIIGLLPMLLNSPAKPNAGEVWLTLLDVGQGLATVVQTTNHVLVYDTGPRFSDSFDTGKAVVAPYLQHRGIGRIDTLVISHGDNDHIGGAQSLSRALPVEEILTSVPGKIPWQRSTPCQRGQQWRWDGVDFEVLHPPSHYRSRGNDGSCVIRVSSRAGDVLLTGDIEALSELELVLQEADALQTRILIAPHHGSKTSSNESFVTAVAPEYVLLPVGYRNRYGLPNAEVVSRYQKAGSRLLDTASHGAISVVMGSQHDILPTTYRSFARRYWHSD
ncbi:MAG: DNA internalization-related competence protein ComEC/Rec2, partial [Gammaproteobacteria bacterium]|nr:DNA internalization-related competence protein ComEC/Rec2 [Gammaproteobacteria bacterium]